LRNATTKRFKARDRACRSGRRRGIVGKLDRGYEDFVSDRISADFWTRKSQEWEAELQVVDAERTIIQQPKPQATASAAKILELAKQAVFLYQRHDPTEQRRRLETGAIELLVRSWNLMSHLH